MPEGFDGFVTARGHALLRFSHVLCGNAHLAEDLVQEVLARVHRKWARIEAMEAPEAYVRKAIVREYLSWRRRRWSTETAVADWPDHLAAGGPDPAVRVAARDEMWRLLSGLPRKQRAALVLRYYLDMTDDEVAATLGCASGTVRAYASRGMARLRKAIVAGDLAGRPAVAGGRAVAGGGHRAGGAVSPGGALPAGGRHVADGAAPAGGRRPAGGAAPTGGRPGEGR